MSAIDDEYGIPSDAALRQEQTESIARAIYESRFQLIGYGEFKWPNVCPFFKVGPTTADGYRQIAERIVTELTMPELWSRG